MHHNGGKERAPHLCLVAAQREHGGDCGGGGGGDEAGLGPDFEQPVVVRDAIREICASLRRRREVWIFFFFQLLCSAATQQLPDLEKEYKLRYRYSVLPDCSSARDISKVRFSLVYGPNWSPSEERN